MKSGFFLFHRVWLEEEVFKNPKKVKFDRLHAWIYLLERAAFKPQTIRERDMLIEIQRGEQISSLRYLAEAWGWNKDTVKRYLKELVATGYITLSLHYNRVLDTQQTTHIGKAYKIIINDYNNLQKPTLKASDPEHQKSETVGRQQADKIETRENNQIQSNDKNLGGASAQAADRPLADLFPNCSSKEDFTNHVPDDWKEFVINLRSGEDGKYEEDVEGFWEYHVDKNPNILRRDWFKVWKKYMSRPFRNAHLS